MYVFAAIGILILGTALNLAVETSAELTAEVLADTEYGIATGPRIVALNDMIDTRPGAMLILPPPPTQAR